MPKERRKDGRATVASGSTKTRRQLSHWTKELDDALCTPTTTDWRLTQAETKPPGKCSTVSVGPGGALGSSSMSEDARSVSKTRTSRTRQNPLCTKSWY